MKTPKRINSLDLIADCTSIGLNKWNALMEGTTKASGETIRKHIRDHAPELYEGLCLDFPNPYESQSVKKKGLLVYVHSGIEYFLKYE